ncbi:hypothetical protein GPROT1_03007 [Gammaproteobacteria bacterium]|nr:hypothetical protein GPROT1_03007 [Gammaproteobacteria bacterium]
MVGIAKVMAKDARRPRPSQSAAGSYQAAEGSSVRAADAPPVAAALGLELDARGFARDLRNHAHEIVQRRRFATGDVDGFSTQGTPRIQRAQDGFHGIGHVEKIARLVAVAVDRDGLALEDARRENRNRRRIG